MEGFVFGDVEMDDYDMRILAVDLQIVIANVEYRQAPPPPSENSKSYAIPRLAPEHPFPISLSDAYAAVKWVRCFLFVVALRRLKPERVFRPSRMRRAYVQIPPKVY